MTTKILTVKSPDLLHDLARRGGFGHEMADLQLIEDADISPQQAFAVAWYVMYCTSPDTLKAAALPATKIEAARLLGVSRPTLDKWISDERLADNGIQRIIDGRLPELMIRGLDRLERIITANDSKDGDAITAFRAVADYDNARRGGAGPGVQVNIDQRQQVIALDEWRERQRRIHEQAEETITIFNEATD